MLSNDTVLTEKNCIGLISQSLNEYLRMTIKSYRFARESRMKGKVGRKVSLFILNAVLVSTLVLNGGLFVAQSHTPVPSSLYFDLDLIDLGIATEGNSLLVDFAGSGTVYLVKNETAVLTNVSMSYELPVLKSILFKLMPKIINQFKNDPKRQDAYIRGNRVFKLLKRVIKVDNHSKIPGDSLIREFIGGSSIIEQ